MTSRSERIEQALREMVEASQGTGTMGDYRKAWARLDAARDEARAALSAPPEEQGGLHAAVTEWADQYLVGKGPANARLYAILAHHAAAAPPEEQGGRPEVMAVVEAARRWRHAMCGTKKERSERGLTQRASEVFAALRALDAAAPPSPSPAPAPASFGWKCEECASRSAGYGFATEADAARALMDHRKFCDRLLVPSPAPAPDDYSDLEEPISKWLDAGAPSPAETRETKP